VKFVRRWGDGPLTAVIDGDYPTEADFQEIRDHHLPLEIWETPGKEHTLDFLSPVFAELTSLRVGGGSCNDLRGVESMTALESLGLSVESAVKVDLSVLPHLVMFAGRWKNFESLTKARSLKELRITGPDVNQLSAIEASLVKLQIFMSRKLVEVPVIPSSFGLQELSIYRSPNVNLGSINHYANLARLELSGCTHLTDAHALLQLPALSYLELENCPDVQQWETLAELRETRVRVIGKNPFTPEFRRAATSTGLWSFPSRM